jgi:hypothetical protein
MTESIKRLRDLLAKAPRWPAKIQHADSEGYLDCPLCDGQGSLPVEQVEELRWGPGDVAVGGIQVYGIGEEMGAMEVLIPQLIKIAPALLEVVEAAAEVRKIQVQRASDEAEWCAAGQTFSRVVLMAAESRLDAGLKRIQAFA